MTVAEYIIKYLELQNKASHIFSVIGGGCIFLSNAAYNSKKFTVVPCLHEQAATIAAESYAQINGLGIALVTTGPGVTNALTGVAGAYLESTPMIVISGQVNTYHSSELYGTRQYGFQEVNTGELVKGIVKKYIKITKYDVLHQRLWSILSELTSELQSNRKGPVWLDVPLDIQNMEVCEDFSEVTSFSHTIEYSPPGIIHNIIEDILNAERPVILAGNGIRLSNSIDDFKNLISILQIPVLCTWKTFDFFTENDELYLGRPGIIASRYANKIQQECDLFLSIGARLDLGQTAFNPNKIAPNAKKYIVDVDNNELSKFSAENTTKICTDAYHFVKSMIPIAKSHIPKHNKWLSYCHEVKQTYDLKKEHLNDEIFNYYKVLPFLSDALYENTILVHGSSGTCSEVTCQALELKHHTRVVGTHGLGSMGFGLPAAIGAWYATGKKIVCVDGDGSFAMNIQELAILEQGNMDIHIIILNNNGYASIRNTQSKLFKDKEYFGSDPQSGLNLPNYEKLAEVFDISYYSVYNTSDLKYLENIKRKNICPCIYEIFLDEVNTQSFPRTKTQKQEDGSIITLPMEDMYPNDISNSYHCL